MRTVSLQWALQAAILAVVVSIAGGAVGASRSAAPSGYLQAKIEYCKDCHGLSGQGYLGFVPIPRLAGQPAEYVENQLRAFVERRREPDIFLNMAKIHGLRPAMRTAVAAHFRDLNPRPFGGGGPRRLAGTGKQIYEEGLPEANIPACSACHGPQARGQEAIPRLAGQLYAYTVKELTHWSGERNQYSTREDPAVVMTPIAHNLTRPQIEAIAAYVSHLE